MSSLVSRSHRPIWPGNGRAAGAMTADGPRALAWPRWFGPASALVAVLAYAGTPATVLLALVIVIAAAACRDPWQFLVTLLLGSLTLATASREVTTLFGQPFLLRFFLAGLLVVMTIQPSGARTAPLGLMRVFRPLLAFFLVAAVGIAWNDVPRVAVEGFLGATLILGVPFSAARYRWRDSQALLSDLAVLHRFLWLLTVLGISIAAADGFGGRATGIHLNPNTYAYVCVLGFGLDLGLRTHLSRRWRGVSAPLFVLGVLASGSRGALLGVLLAASYLLFRLRGRERSVRITVALLLGLSVLLVAPLPPPFSLQNVIERTFGGDELDLSGRQQNWDNMVLLFQQRPVLGHGLRTTNERLTSASSAGLIEGGGGHSSYLQMLVETGILGTALLFGSVVLVLRRPVPNDAGLLPAWTAASGVVIAGLGHMTGESFVLGVGGPFPLVFWTSVVALSCAGSNSRRLSRVP
jgi:hypothetical protein